MQLKNSHQFLIEQGQRVLDALRSGTSSQEVNITVDEERLQEEADIWLEENEQRLSEEEKKFIRYFSCRQVDPDSNTCARNSLYCLSESTGKKLQ